MAGADREAQPLLRAARRAMPASAPIWAASRRGWRGARLFGAMGRMPRNAAALAQALGGLKGPDHEGGAAARHHSRPDAARIRRGAAEAAERGAAHGRGLRQAAHAGGARAGLAGAASARSISSPPPPPRSAKSTARRRRTARRSPASSNIPTCNRPWRRTSQQLEFVFALHRRMDPAIDTARSPRRSARGCARSSITRARPSTRRSMRMRSRTWTEVRVPRVHPELSTQRLLALEWLEGEKILHFHEADVEIRNRLAVAMFKAWWHPFSHCGGDPRRSASRQLHGVLARAASRRASTCSITAASASSIRASSAAWSISIAGSANR